jgi:hypothetical protein
VLASHCFQTVATMNRLLIILCLSALWSCASGSEKHDEKAQVPAAQYVAERGMTDGATWEACEEFGQTLEAGRVAHANALGYGDLIELDTAFSSKSLALQFGDRNQAYRAIARSHVEILQFQRHAGLLPESLKFDPNQVTLN